ncbi:MAG TPA: homocysteine S-methyltransferase family protein [Caulifigura sp.]|nr:homocysteine S-methyltransferase family protein [Caulifigura sp.]
MSTSLADLLNSPRPLLIDGATGTELERRGYPLAAAGWSARAIEDVPDLLEQIHRDYVDAGARLITANTFRLHRRNLDTWGRASSQQALVDQGVRLARRAARHKALVAASLAPIGDCYSPDEVPSPARLADEHAELAQALATAGADVILIETMVAGVEAEAASRAAAGTGLPFIVSFVTGPRGQLLTGERLEDLLPAILKHSPAAIGINCVSCRDVDSALDQLLVEGQPRPIGVYANTGERAEDGSWRVTTASQPAVYAGIAGRWLERGIAFVGGCCGTTPAHIAELQVSMTERLP